MKNRFATPYLLGRPYGIEGTIRWINKVSEISGLVPNFNFIQLEKEKVMNQMAPAIPILKHIIRDHSDISTISIGGHADVVRGVIEYAEKELNLIKGTCWCDCPSMKSEEIPYFEEDEWVQSIQSNRKGILMGSGESLKWANRSLELQISNPDIKWRLNPYESPFVGFYGAINLVNLWLNETLYQINT